MPGFYRYKRDNGNIVIIERAGARLWEWYEYRPEKVGLPINGTGICASMTDCMAEAGVSADDRILTG